MKSTAAGSASSASSPRWASGTNSTSGTATRPSKSALLQSCRRQATRINLGAGDPRGTHIVAPHRFGAVRADRLAGFAEGAIERGDVFVGNRFRIAEQPRAVVHFGQLVE